MAHGMILGPTGTGKTTLAKAMVEKAGSAGVPVLVLDPSRARWDGADFCTPDTDTFIAYVFANTRCLVIVDEAAEAIGQAKSDAERHRLALATRTRHRGHSVIFISQFASGVARGIRRQCQRVWTFRQSVDDCKILAREFCNTEIIQASSLARWEYLYADTFGSVEKGNILTLDNAQKIRSPSRELKLVQS